MSGIVVGLILFYALLQFLVSRHFPGLNPCLGAVLAVMPVGLVYAFGDAPWKLGSLLFIALSLILTSVRADGGCEVMTIPGLLFGKRTHLVCIAFSPIDWLEDRLSRRADSAAADEQALPR